MGAVELVRRIAEVVNIDQLYFASTEAQRETAHYPRDVTFDGTYSSQPRISSATTFDVTVGFTLTVSGIDGTRIVILRSVIVIKYRVPQESAKVLTEESVNIFGQVNAVYHAYPYFREFVQSSAGRMNLPTFIMPAMPAKGLFEQINSDALKVLPMRGKRSLPAPDRQAANE